MMKHLFDQKYQTIYNTCKLSGKLFVDPHFCVKNGRRPHQLVANPQFVVDEYSFHDVDQGSISDCWFISACVSLVFCKNKELFFHIVPQDQSFNKNEYFGVFHFRFWQLGKWIDVVIDDLLPDKRCKNVEEMNEFWPSLLEKAFAKFYGGYHNLEWGFSSDALLDLCGGLLEQDFVKNISFATLENWIYNESLICVFFPKKNNGREFIDSNGLVGSHAYSILDVSSSDDSTDNGKVCLRNPWANSIEWKHQNYDKHTDRKDDGVFWMNFDDFAKHFTCIDVVHTSSNGFTRNYDKLWQPIIQVQGNLSRETIAINLNTGLHVISVTQDDCLNNRLKRAKNPIKILVLDENNNAVFETEYVETRQLNRTFHVNYVSLYQIQIFVKNFEVNKLLLRLFANV